MGLEGEFGRLGHPSSYSSSASFSIHSNPEPQHCAKSSQETGSWVEDGLWVQSPKPILLLLPGSHEG